MRAVVPMATRGLGLVVPVPVPVPVPGRPAQPDGDRQPVGGGHPGVGGVADLAPEPEAPGSPWGAGDRACGAVQPEPRREVARGDLMVVGGAAQRDLDPCVVGRMAGGVREPGRLDVVSSRAHRSRFDHAGHASSSPRDAARTATMRKRVVVWRAAICRSADAGSCLFCGAFVIVSRLRPERQPLAPVSCVGVGQSCGPLVLIERTWSLRLGLVVSNRRWLCAATVCR